MALQRSRQGPVRTTTVAGASSLRALGFGQALTSHGSVLVVVVMVVVVVVVLWWRRRRWCRRVVVVVVKVVVVVVVDGGGRRWMVVVVVVSGGWWWLVVGCGDGDCGGCSARCSLRPRSALSWCWLRAWLCVNACDCGVMGASGAL